MYGKGTREFDAYVANLQKAIRSSTIGSQLGQGDLSRSRGALIHNPYITTVADKTIYSGRGESGSARA